MTTPGHLREAPDIVGALHPFFGRSEDVLGRDSDRGGDLDPPYPIVDPWGVRTIRARRKSLVLQDKYKHKEESQLLI